MEVKSPNGTEAASAPPAAAAAAAAASENGKDEEQPRALHRTTSIFLRNLAPTITKAEVEAMCKR